MRVWGLEWSLEGIPSRPMGTLRTSRQRSAPEIEIRVFSFRGKHDVLIVFHRCARTGREHAHTDLNAVKTVADKELNLIKKACLKKSTTTSVSNIATCKGEASLCPHFQQDNDRIVGRQTDKNPHADHAYVNSGRTSHFNVVVGA